VTTPVDLVQQHIDGQDPDEDETGDEERNVVALRDGGVDDEPAAEHEATGLSDDRQRRVRLGRRHAPSVSQSSSPRLRS
jgi:hypothetical protein